MVELIGSFGNVHVDDRKCGIAFLGFVTFRWHDMRNESRDRRLTFWSIEDVKDSSRLHASVFVQLQVAIEYKQGGQDLEGLEVFERADPHLPKNYVCNRET
jgi:hypothetical protein